MDRALIAQVRGEIEDEIEAQRAKWGDVIENTKFILETQQYESRFRGIRDKLAKLKKIAAINTLPQEDYGWVLRAARIAADWELCFKVLQAWEQKGGRNDPKFYIGASLLDFTDGMRRFFYERVVELATQANDEQTRAMFQSKILDLNVKNYSRETNENKFFTVCLPKGKTDKKDGCFVATAIYGEGSQQVDVLKRFRDGVLAQTPHGRLFITVYYRYGPRLSIIVLGRPRLKTAVRYGLDCLVGLLERLPIRATVPPPPSNDPAR